MRFYVRQPLRITTPTIESHFQEEGVEDEIKVFDYDMVKSGLADIVSIELHKLKRCENLTIMMRNFVAITGRKHH